LSPYKGKYMPESQIRNLIKEAGLEAVPRPNGIPENFRVKISKRCSGIIYAHPEHEQTSIRIMFGKSHSPYPAQRKPYAIFQKDGKFYDKFGNAYLSESVEVHIPIEDLNLELLKNGIR
jgi:hypothetical protein